MKNTETNFIENAFKIDECRKKKCPDKEYEKVMKNAQKELVTKLKANQVQVQNVLSDHKTNLKQNKVVQKNYDCLAKKCQKQYKNHLKSSIAYFENSPYAEEKMKIYKDAKNIKKPSGKDMMNVLIK